MLRGDGSSHCIECRPMPLPSVPTTSAMKPCGAIENLGFHAAQGACGVGRGVRRGPAQEIATGGDVVPGPHAKHGVADVACGQIGAYVLVQGHLGVRATWALLVMRRTVFPHEATSRPLTSLATGGARAVLQPRIAASMAATSIFLIVIMASKARLAAAGSALV